MYTERDKRRRNQHYIFATTAIVILIMLFVLSEKSPEAILKDVGYTDVQMGSETPGCLDGKGQFFSATSADGHYHYGVLCIYKDKPNAVTVITDRKFN